MVVVGLASSSSGSRLELCPAISSAHDEYSPNSHSRSNLTTGNHSLWLGDREPLGPASASTSVSSPYIPRCEVECQHTNDAQIEHTSC